MVTILNQAGIEDIWIMTDDGIVIFTTNEYHMDVQLFGGFLTALKQFAEVLTKGELKSIDVGIEKYYILKTMNLTFVASARASIDEKMVIHQLRTVRTQFLKLYPPEYFEKWNHNTSQFTSFSNELSMRVIS